MQGYGTEAPLVFRGEFPRLKMLNSLYYATWPLGSYATLTHAELLNHDQRVTLASLLDALTGCMALEGLILQGYVRLGRGILHLTPVFLPRLRQIDLVTCDSALILEHLEAPSLRGPVVVYDSSPRGHILRSLPAHQYDTPYLQGITSLVIDLTQSPCHFVSGFRADGSCTFYVGVDGAPSRAKRSWTQLSFVTVASFSPFFNIRSLTLVTDALTVSWELWLPNLNFLVEFTVSCPRLDNLISALLAPLDTRLPSLQRLTLRRFGIFAILDHRNLMAFVLYRYEAGSPLRQLQFDREEWERIQKRDETWVLLVKSQC